MFNGFLTRAPARTADRTIAVVSTSRETLDGVGEYLRRAGARTMPVAQFTDTSAMPDVDAVILFADDFPRAAALDACEHREGKEVGR